MSTPRRLHSMVLSLTAALALGTGAASAATPAGATPTDSAWIVVRNPQQPSGIPAGMDRGNSTGGSVTWQRLSVGSYEVTIEGLDNHGVPQVTALATVPRICSVSGWGQSFPNVVTIECIDTTATLRDTPFALTYTRGTGGSGGTARRLAHAWLDADEPTAYYNHVTGGGQITRSTSDTGHYQAVIPGVGTVGDAGSVQITMYDFPGYCTTDFWSAGPPDLRVNYICRDLDGTPADTDADLLFLRKLGPEGFGGGPAAYLWGDRKGANAAYQPNSNYAWQSNGKRSTIARTGVGIYKVTLTGLPKGGAATVTAHGGGTARCQLGKILTAAPATVVVRCYKPDGTLVNSNFTLAWTK